MHSANNECTLLLTAHIACLRTETLGEMDGGSGEVISDTTVGGKAQAYKPQAEDGCDVWYMRSAYGRAFKALEKRLPRHAVSFFIG